MTGELDRELAFEITRPLIQAAYDEPSGPT